MAEIELENIEVQNEFQQIMHHIKNEDNFLLSGGAGSGKTYTLVQVIKQIIEDSPTSKIACMTYTNAAVKEIEERVNNKNLNVSTIHDFLWDNIKHFQTELKKSLVAMVNDEEEAKIKIDEDIPLPNDYFNNLEDGIQYKEFLRIKDGIISHDEILILSNYLFKTYPKINSILKDKFQFIFIDEYQDTNEKVIEIFLKHFKNSQKKNVIGFFGDVMQSIYDEGIGNIDIYKGDGEGQVKEVPKDQNRRNPQLIIDLANRLRTDGLEQVPSEDLNAPNMNEDGTIKKGNIKFIYSNDNNINKVKEYLNWDFSDSKETKELNLTHNLIADKAGIRSLMNIYNSDGILKYKSKVKKYIKENNIETDFSDKTFGEVLRILNVTPSRGGMQNFINDNPNLYAEALTQNWETFSKMYVDKDQLLDSKKQDSSQENKKGSKRDALIRHLFKIQNNIFLYQSRQYNEFLRVTDFRHNIRTIEDKRILKTSIESLINVGDKTIEKIINEANEKGICIVDDTLNRFILKKEYLYNRVKEVKFKEFQKLYDYLEGFTPFSTQHKTKGTEFNNVLVVLDNGNWNDYNFKYLLDDSIYQTLSNSKKESYSRILPRTQKIFYVCCTRAKESLAVYYLSPSNGVIERAVEWFGRDCVIDLDSI
jgi:DNA helicase-2/ATP-dependent DNA helicase PcrA